MSEHSDPGNNPTLTATFNAAAADSPSHTEGVTGSAGPAADPHQHTAATPELDHDAPGLAPDQTDPYAHLTDAEREELRMMLEDGRGELVEDRHYRHDDKKLVQEVHTDIEANREHTIKTLTPEPEIEPEAEYSVDPDFDDGFDYTM